jgi:Terminase DNA packaging enzyme
MSTYDGLDEIFDVESTEIIESKPEELTQTQKPEIQQDYEITRAQLHSLVMKGQEAIDGILDVAKSSDHPRAYEVAGQLIKNVADVADKLIDLQKKMKDIDEKPRSSPTTVNNTMFVGSTSELAKLLKQNSKQTK